MVCAAFLPIDYQITISALLGVMQGQEIFPSLWIPLVFSLRVEVGIGSLETQKERKRGLVLSQLLA